MKLGREKKSPVKRGDFTKSKEDRGLSVKDLKYCNTTLLLNGSGDQEPSKEIMKKYIKI